MDTVEEPNEFLEHVNSADEYPSDADVAEAKHLSEDVAEKHRRRKRRLEEQFKNKKESQTESEIREEKRKSKSKLKPKLSKEEQSQQVDDGTVDDHKNRRRRRREMKEKSLQSMSSTTDGQIGPEGVPRLSLKQSEDDLGQSEAGLRVEEAPTKKVSRLALAAAKREQKRLEKEAELMKTRDEEDGLKAGDTSDRPLSTRFDPDQMFSGRYKSSKEPEINWETLKAQESVTDKQAYDFFCRQWPAHSSIAKETENKEQSNQETEGQPKDETDDQTKLIQDAENKEFEEYRGLKSGRFFLENKYPLLMPTTEKWDKWTELDLYYLPGEVDPTFRNETQLRNLEEEGLYVGKRPTVSGQNERRLESRVQKENKIEWFGEDGRIRIQPDPLKEIPFRPLMWNDQFNPMPSYLKTENVKPIVSGPGQDYQFDNSDSAASFEMIVNLDHLQFTHHHLFSEEHVYAERLKQLFIVYEYITKQEGLDYFEQRILSVKHAIEHLIERQRVHDVNNNQAATQENLQRIASYRQEIRNTRIARNNEEAHLRKIIASIIKTWKQLKKQRADSGMTLTDVVVKIKKEETNQAQDNRELELEIAEQVEENRELYRATYEVEIDKYRVKKGLYDKQQDEKEQARSRQAALRSKEEQGKLDEGDLDEMELFQQKQDSEILGQPELSRPSTPDKFSESDFREKVLREIRECRRLPGEPKIIPLLKTGPVSEANISQAEQNRRNLMRQYSYYGELYFNGKKVVTTSTCQLNSDFVLRFGETIPIIISQYPQIIVLKVYERLGMKSNLLCKLELDVPPPQRVFNSSNGNGSQQDLEIYNFHTAQVLTHKDNVSAVGSGERAFLLESLQGNPSGDQVTPLFTTGTIYAYSCWAVDDEGLLKIPSDYLASERFKNQRHVRDPLLALGLNKILEDQRRQEWKNIESHLDPNNPIDAKVIKALHTHEHLGMDPSAIVASDYFRLNPYMDEFDLTSQEDLERSVRFRMIALRSMGIPSFINQPIPAYDDRVPIELIREYDNRKTIDKNKSTKSNFDQRKLLHQEFVEKIREEVMMKFKNSLEKRGLSEMVREEIIPTISEFFPKLKIFSYQRPLQRVSESTKPIPIQSIYEMNVDILVVIKQSTNLPVDKIKGTINPFVQVQFQNSARYTPVLEGPNPAWNNELRLRFKPPSYFTTLDAVKDSILINIYDQQVIDMNDRDIGKSTTLHERYERHNLGSLEIPFNTIYMNGKVEGNFRLKQPPFLLGYTNTRTNDRGEGASMLSVFITLDPEIHPPQPLKERVTTKFDSMEDPNDLAHIETWYTQLSTRFKKRFRRVTVVDMRCQETIITRYISPLMPPPDVTPTPEALASYVSKIPFMADSLVFPGISDIWSTCDQFLKMLIGDEEEHAVLLCNYFLSVLDPVTTSVYLCMGDAIPEGSTAYVLTIDKTTGAVTLWNPSSGVKFNKDDTTCPMFSLGLLVNHQNVWANVQASIRPCDMKFDLSNPRNWQALFNSNIRPRPTVQPEAILYQEPFLKEIDDFQLRLDSDIRNSIMDWRLGLKTNFLLGMRRDIINILMNLEASCGQISPDCQKEIDRLHKGYQKVFGFPLNLAYMEIPELLARIRATGIHLTAAPKAEFSVATYIKAYSNSVLSIWIYVAALIPD